MPPSSIFAVYCTFIETPLFSESARFLSDDEGVANPAVVRPNQLLTN